MLNALDFFSIVRYILQLKNVKKTKDDLMKFQQYISLKFFFLLVAFCGQGRASEALYTVIEDQAQLPLRNLTFSERKTLKIRLKNGLEAYLISDPKADKSAVALAVQAGSWQDPKEYPGIAHFLEHMLFLGTSKYPEEGEYDSFITSNGGSLNAYTASDYTAFMASVDNSALESLLDRFSYFFKEPLFNPSGVARELQAIDQEYAKNIENDDIRMLYVSKELANKEHPYYSFNMGNSTTLSKVSQDTLKEWYKQHYSANLMHLIVYSPLPLEKLKELVVNDFQDVPNNDAKPFSTEIPLISPKLTGQMVYVTPLKNEHRLVLTWVLPREFSRMRESQPGTIVCYVMGHEGKESLLAQLKREKLAETLSCNEESIALHDRLFSLEIGLTDEGVNHVNQVIELCFQAIANFKQKGVPEYLFDEVKRMATINYEYQQRRNAFDYLMQLAGWIVEEDLASFPEKTKIIQKFDPEAVKALLNYLTPQHAHYYLRASEAYTKVKTDRKEKWIGAEYAIQEIPVSTLEAWSHVLPHSKIDLPQPNQLIPENLSLVNQSGKAVPLAEQKLVPKPEVLLNDKKGLIYFASDQRYLIPRVSWHFQIKTPQIEIGNASKVVLADLYVKSLTELLNRFSYNARQAGLDFSIERADYGLQIVIWGYSQNAHLLLEEILKQLKNVNVSEQRFSIFKESLSRQYQNAAKEPPLTQAIALMKSGIFKRYTLDKQKVLAISKVTYEKFNDYVGKLYNQVYVEGMLYGNMKKDQASQLIDKLFAVLQGAPYAKEKQKKVEVIDFPENKGPFYFECSTKVQGNAVFLAIQNGKPGFKGRAAQEIMMQSIREPFFTALRTTQQTGYIVISKGDDVHGQLFDFFAVQSNTHDVRDLLARYELFLEGYLQEIKQNITEEEFHVHQTSLLEELQQAPKSLEEMGDLLNELAFEKEGDFDFIDKRIQGFKELTYAEFLTDVNTFIGRKNRKRFAILLRGVIPVEKLFHYHPIKSVAQLRKISTFEQE